MNIGFNVLFRKLLFWKLTDFSIIFIFTLIYAIKHFLDVLFRFHLSFFRFNLFSILRLHWLYHFSWLLLLILNIYNFTIPIHLNLSNFAISIIEHIVIYFYFFCWYLLIIIENISSNAVTWLFWYWLFISLIIEIHIRFEVRNLWKGLHWIRFTK